MLESLAKKSIDTQCISNINSYSTNILLTLVVYCMSCHNLLADAFMEEAAIVPHGQWGRICRGAGAGIC